MAGNSLHKNDFFVNSSIVICKATTAGYLLADKRKFHDIADRLLKLDEATLNNLVERLSYTSVKPETEEEKACFRIIADLNHVNYKVQGSITSKKYMRNEIWSLVSYLGAPSWFITFAPADVKHPIALYFADTSTKYVPECWSSDERWRLIANNPVAGARFFNMMADLFIKHVLGVGTGESGIYGDTSGYYGTVEQQGCLTLHLHLLLWLKNALTPQEIRDRIMDPNSDFQKAMVEYLESVHVGEFMTGTAKDVRERIDKLNQENPARVPPTETLPEAPPEKCDHAETEMECKACKKYDSWWRRFRDTVDELLLLSNMHNCTPGAPNLGNGKSETKGCIDKKMGKCCRRFPRPTYAETTMVQKLEL